MVKIKGFVLYLGVLSVSFTYPASAQKTPSGTQSSDVSLPVSPLSEQAKKAYNEGRYNEAARHFRQLAIRWPQNGKVYQALARAYSWASEPAKAIIAYRHALSLGMPSAEQEKMKAELDLLIRRVKKVPPKDPPKDEIKAFEALGVRAKVGKFIGPDGAITGLEKLLETTEVSPRVGQIKALIAAELNRQSEDALTRWWRAEAVVSTDTLVELTNAWRDWRLFLGESVEKPLEKKLAGLRFLAQRQWTQAIDVLGAAAADDVRIRYALSIALIRAERYPEAQDLLSALGRGDADPRVYLLTGFVQQKLENAEAVEAFMSALENEDTP